jgi:hypothetical protein
MREVCISANGLGGIHALCDHWCRIGWRDVSDIRERCPKEKDGGENNNGAHSLLALGLKWRRVRRIRAVPRRQEVGARPRGARVVAAAGGGAQGATQGRPRSTIACEGRRAAAFASTYGMTPIRLDRFPA